MIKQHKQGCLANTACAVYHPDGICPGPYGKCTCDGTDSQVGGAMPSNKNTMNKCCKKCCSGKRREGKLHKNCLHKNDCPCKCHTPQPEKVKMTCLSLDCPERTGGECNAMERIKPQTNGWEKFRKNLQIMIEKYPNLAMDAVDSASLCWIERIASQKSDLIKELEGMKKEATGASINNPSRVYNQALSDIIAKLK